ncbi:hypothetical protein K239x_59130 [Planctomycetes bacterium K23_9]|uniref:Uncharacterized protein n=1 Tax=Stieleria marina TaxID=1930275 RepID=A0A517P3E8_9BACT|nr:hypothetical protein K239x_59130 [Planctomycetes bacterium K23_9]
MHPQIVVGLAIYNRTSTNDAEGYIDNAGLVCGCRSTACDSWLTAASAIAVPQSASLASFS